MKRLMFVLLGVSLLFSVHAQPPKFGIKAGLNLSKLGYSNNVEADWKTGFHAGLLSHIHVTPAFSLQPEVYYSDQGAEFENGNNTTEINLGYVNIPVLFQYNFNNGFRLQGGPQLGILVSDEVEVNGVQVNSNPGYQNIDFSLPIGVSYLSYSGFGVDARYNIGLSDITDGDAIKVRNNVIQLGLFYLFDHRHKAKSR